MAPSFNWQTDLTSLGELLTWDVVMPMAVFLALLVGWIVLMALTGWVAGRKGRNSGDWALLGLVLGPLALVMALLARPVRAPEPGDGPRLGLSGRA